MKRREPRQPSNSSSGSGSRAKADDKTLTSFSVGALPILNRVMKRARIRDFLESYLPQDHRYKISSATAGLLLLRNYICSREPLYGVGEWASRYDPSLLELSERDVRHLNDDRVGRCLNKLFESDMPSLILAIVVHVIKEFKVSLAEMHNDSTTITLTGRYEGAREERRHKGKVLHAITWGHSKQHRPDLKQLLYNLTIAADGAVPVHFFIGNGNLTDDKVHQPTWDLLRELKGTADFLYVADSKLATVENMRYIHGRGGRFISVLPQTRSECKDFRRLLTQGAISWKRIWQKCDDEGKVTNTYSIATHPGTSAEGYRLMWFHSTRKTELDELSRNDRLQRGLRALATLRQKLNSPRTRHRQEARVREAVEKRLGPLGVMELIRVTIHTIQKRTYRQVRRGRPGKDTRYERHVRTTFDIEYTIDHMKVAEDSLQDGVFPLITNDRKLTELETLHAYKRQPLIEKRFSQLKTDFEVAPVYLKSPWRVEALLCIYFLALLVQALLERETRKAMEKNGINDLPLYPEGRPCRAPTTRRIVDLFENIQRHTLRTPAGETSSFVTDFSFIQEQVARLLGMAHDNYVKKA